MTDGGKERLEKLYDNFKSSKDFKREVFGIPKDRWVSDVQHDISKADAVYQRLRASGDIPQEIPFESFLGRIDHASVRPQPIPAAVKPVGVLVNGTNAVPSIGREALTQALEPQKEALPQPAKKPTLLQQGSQMLTDFASGFNRVIAKTPSAIAKTAAELGTGVYNLAGGNAKVEEDYLYQLADKYDKWIDDSPLAKQFIGDKNINSLSSDVGSGAGQIASVLMSGGGSTGAKLAANPTILKELGKKMLNRQTGIAFTQVFNSEYEGMKAQGESDETAFDQALLNGIAMAPLENIPLANLAERMKKAVGAPIAKRILNAIIQSTEEGGQEALQQLLSNTTNNQLVELEKNVKDWSEGLSRSAEAGGIVGGLLGMIAGVKGGRIKKQPPKQLGGILTQPAQEPIKNQDGTITFRVNNIDEIPPQFRDRAQKTGLSGTSSTLPFGFGKKTNIQQYRYDITENEYNQLTDKNVRQLENTIPVSETIYETVTDQELSDFEAGNELNPERQAALLDDLAQGIRKSEDPNYQRMLDLMWEQQDRIEDGGQVDEAEIYRQEARDLTRQSVQNTYLTKATIPGTDLYALIDEVAADQRLPDNEKAQIQELIESEILRSETPVQQQPAVTQQQLQPGNEAPNVQAKEVVVSLDRFEGQQGFGIVNGVEKPGVYGVLDNGFVGFYSPEDETTIPLRPQNIGFIETIKDEDGTVTGARLADFTNGNQFVVNNPEIAIDLGTMAMQGDLQRLSLEDFPPAQQQIKTSEPDETPLPPETGLSDQTISVEGVVPSFTPPSIEVNKPEGFAPYLRKLGYTDEEISGMTIDQQQEIAINKTEPARAESTAKVDAVKENAKQERLAEMQLELDEEPVSENEGSANKALSSVEETAKALEGKKLSLDEKAKKLGYIGIKQFNAQNQLNENLTDEEKALLQEYSDFQQEIKNLKDENVIAKLSDDEFSTWSKANDITRDDLGKVVKDEEIELAAKRIRILNARGDSKKAESELKKLKESKKKDNWTKESWKERFDEDIEQSEIDEINSSNKEFNKSVDKAVESLLSKEQATSSKSEIEAKKADIERRRQEELDANSDKSKLLNTPTQDKQEALNKGQKVLDNNKDLVEQLEKEFTNEDETLFNELVEKLEKLIKDATKGEGNFAFRNGKVKLTIDEVRKGNVTNANYTGSREGQVGEFEIGDNIQISNGSVSIPGTVTKVSSTGRVIEVKDKNGVILVRNGIVLSSNTIQRDREINAKYDAELKAVESLLSKEQTEPATQEEIEATAKALEGIDESQLPEVIDKESYLAKNGAPFMGGAEPALHKNIQEGRAKQQMIKRVSDEMNKNNQKREELRKEYEQKVKEGKILPPNRNDKLIASANSNPDLESTQAARRLLEKKGIDWQIGKTKPQSISEAYHKAKSDGSNPELVKAVEELLGTEPIVKPTPVPLTKEPTGETKTTPPPAGQSEGKPTARTPKKLKFKSDSDEPVPIYHVGHSATKDNPLKPDSRGLVWFSDEKENYGAYEEKGVPVTTINIPSNKVLDMESESADAKKAQGLIKEGTKKELNEIATSLGYEAVKTGKDISISADVAKKYLPESLTDEQQKVNENIKKEEQKRTSSLIDKLVDKPKRKSPKKLKFDSDSDAQAFLDEAGVTPESLPSILLPFGLKSKSDDKGKTFYYINLSKAVNKMMEADRIEDYLDEDDKSLMKDVSKLKSAIEEARKENPKDFLQSLIDRAEATKAEIKNSPTSGGLVYIALVEAYIGVLKAAQAAGRYINQAKAMAEARKQLEGKYTEAQLTIAENDIQDRESKRVKAAINKAARVRKVKDSVQSAIDKAFAVGMGYGKQEGFTKGATEGGKAAFITGKELGAQQGFEKGFTKGATEGGKAGFITGKEVGKQEGFTKGATEGMKAGAIDGRQQAVQMLKKALEPLKADLSPKQIAAITTRLGKLKTFSDEARQRFYDYAEKVVEDANYVLKESAARQLRSDVKGMSERSTTSANDRSLYGAYAGLSIDHMEPSVLDQYIEWGKKIKGKALTKGDRASLTDFIRDTKRTEDAIRTQQSDKMKAGRERNLREEFEKLEKEGRLPQGITTFEQYKESKKPKSKADTLEAKQSRIQGRLKNIPEGDHPLIDQLRKADLTSLTGTDLDLIDNALYNFEDTGKLFGIGDPLAKAQALGAVSQAVKEGVESRRQMDKSDARILSLTNLFSTLGATKGVAAKLRNLLIQPWLQAATQTNTKYVEHELDIMKEADRLKIKQLNWNRIDLFGFLNEAEDNPALFERLKKQKLSDITTLEELVARNKKRNDYSRSAEEDEVHLESLKEAVRSMGLTEDATLEDVKENLTRSEQDFYNKMRDYLDMYSGKAIENMELYGNKEVGIIKNYWPRTTNRNQTESKDQVQPFDLYGSDEMVGKNMFGREKGRSRLLGKAGYYTPVGQQNYFNGLKETMLIAEAAHEYHKMQSLYNIKGKGFDQLVEGDGKGDVRQLLIDWITDAKNVGRYTGGQQSVFAEAWEGLQKAFTGALIKNPTQAIKQPTALGYAFAESPKSTLKAVGLISQALVQGKNSPLNKALDDLFGKTTLGLRLHHPDLVMLKERYATDHSKPVRKAKEVLKGINKYTLGEVMLAADKFTSQVATLAGYIENAESGGKKFNIFQEQAAGFNPESLAAGEQMQGKTNNENAAIFFSKKQLDNRALFYLANFQAQAVRNLYQNMRKVFSGISEQERKEGAQGIAGYLLATGLFVGAGILSKEFTNMGANALYSALLGDDEDKEKLKEYQASRRGIDGKRRLASEVITMFTAPYGILAKAATDAALAGVEMAYESQSDEKEKKEDRLFFAPEAPGYAGVLADQLVTPVQDVAKSKNKTKEALVQSAVFSSKVLGLSSAAFLMNAINRSEKQVEKAEKTLKEKTKEAFNPGEKEVADLKKSLIEATKTGDEESAKKALSKYLQGQTEGEKRARMYEISDALVKDKIASEYGIDEYDSEKLLRYVMKGDTINPRTKKPLTVWIGNKKTPIGQVPNVDYESVRQRYQKAIDEESETINALKLLDRISDVKNRKGEKINFSSQYTPFRDRLADK